MIKWILFIAGLVLSAVALLGDLAPGFNAPSWVLAAGVVAALVGLLLFLLPANSVP